MLWHKKAAPPDSASPKSDFLALAYTSDCFPPPLTPPPGAGNFFLCHFSRASAREK